MIIGSTIWRTHETTDSMLWARENCFKAADGALFIPDNYIAAQGRNNRSWTLAYGQLTLTLLLKPTITNAAKENASAALMMAIALGILDPLQGYGVALKWPNDFMLHNKKLGGVRIDVVWTHNKPYAFIVGFSLNINNSLILPHPLHYRAISLRDATTTEYSIPLLQQDIIRSLNATYSQWNNHQYDILIDAWQAALLYKNELLSIHKTDGSLITGSVIEFNRNGDLVLLVNNAHVVVPFFLVDEIAPV